jgi:anti-sigma factor RsiW
MNYKHEELEWICALAASGQLTENDRTELEEHALTCTDCHERLMEMEQASMRISFCSQIK